MATKKAKKLAKPAAGPLTLEEAQAIAKAKRPVRTMRRAAAAAKPPTEKDVGDEKKAVKSERDKERKRRESEYKDVMTLLERHGVRKAASGTSGGRKTVRRAGAVAKPLRVMAEGDSWFEYPIPLFGGGIVPRLQKRLGVPILNLAGAGDEVRFMLGVEQRKRLIRALTQGSPAGGSWDVVLFSGGGNDITDNPMALWIRDYVHQRPPASLIHQPRFDAALAMVRAGYEDLIALPDNLSASTQLIFHGYDFALPDGRGVCGHGPWLKPTFDLRGFPHTNSDASCHQGDAGAVPGDAQSAGSRASEGVGRCHARDVGAERRFLAQRAPSEQGGVRGDGGEVPRAYQAKVSGARALSVDPRIFLGRAAQSAMASVS